MLVALRVSPLQIDSVGLTVGLAIGGAVSTGGEVTVGLPGPSSGRQ